MGLPRKLTKYVLFNDAEAYLCEVAEVTLPKLERDTEAYRAGGMPGEVMVDRGMKAMMMEWTAGGFIRTVLTQWGASRADAVQLRFVGALQSDDHGIPGVVEVLVRGRHTEIDFGKAKTGDKTEIQIKTALTYYRITLNGEELIEYDFINMIEKVAGDDVLSPVRAVLVI